MISINPLARFFQIFLTERIVGKLASILFAISWCGLLSMASSTALAQRFVESPVEVLRQRPVKPANSLEQMAGKIKRALQRFDRPLGDTFPPQATAQTHLSKLPNNPARIRTAPQSLADPNPPQYASRTVDPNWTNQSALERRQSEIARTEQAAAQLRADEITRRRHQQWLETHDQWPDPISQFGIAQAAFEQQNLNANPVRHASPRPNPQAPRQEFLPSNPAPVQQHNHLSPEKSPVRQAMATEQFPVQGTAQYQYLNAQPAHTIPGQPTVPPNVTVNANGGFVGEVSPQSPPPHFGITPTTQLPAVTPLEAPVPNGFQTEHTRSTLPGERWGTPVQNRAAASVHPRFHDQIYSSQLPVSGGQPATEYRLEGTELRQRAPTATERALEMKEQNELLQQTIAKLNAKIRTLTDEIETEKNNVQLQAQKTQEVQALLEKSNSINALLRESVARNKVKVEQLEKEKILIQEDANKALREIETTLDAVLLNTISSSRNRQLQQSP